MGALLQEGRAMTNYKQCRFCGARRMLTHVKDGVKHLVCFACFRIQKRVKKGAA